MKLYEVLYTYDGPENRLYSLGPVSLKPKIPLYLYEDELPLPLKDIRKLKDLIIREAKFAVKPKQELVEAKARGSAGIVWEGASPSRATNYGVFKRGDVRYDLSSEAVEYLAAKTGFRKITE